MLNTDRGLSAKVIDESTGIHQLATGDILVLAIETPSGVTYKYDDTNPDAELLGCSQTVPCKPPLAGAKQYMPTTILSTKPARAT